MWCGRSLDSKSSLPPEIAFSTSDLIASKNSTELPYIDFLQRNKVNTFGRTEIDTKGEKKIFQIILLLFFHSNRIFTILFIELEKGHDRIMMQHDFSPATIGSCTNEQFFSLLHVNLQFSTSARRGEYAYIPLCSKSLGDYKGIQSESQQLKYQAYYKQIYKHIFVSFMTQADKAHHITILRQFEALPSTVPGNGILKWTFPVENHQQHRVTTLDTCFARTFKTFTNKNWGNWSRLELVTTIVHISTFSVQISDPDMLSLNHQHMNNANLEFSTENSSGSSASGVFPGHANHEHFFDFWQGKARQVRG
jgi:hypothetical protein